MDDKYRSLPDMPDRVFSTIITADWEYESLAGLDFDTAYDQIQDIMLDVFAGPTDTGVYSKSVQQTQHKTQAAILERVPQGWKFISCSHSQELCQQTSWFLIGCTGVNNQSEARSGS